MAKVITLPKTHQQNDLDAPLPDSFKQSIEERKAVNRKPLTPQKVKGSKGLENLSDSEAKEAVDTIKALAQLLFKIHCHKQSICIDNQQVVNLNQENKAA